MAGGIFALFVACCVCFYPLYWMVRVPQTNVWVRGSGQILTSNIERVGGGKSGINFRPVITYRYRVNGLRYQSTVWRIHPDTVSEQGFADAVMRQYPAGTTTTVYYNPVHPDQSYLAPSAVIGTDYAILILGGLVFLCASLWTGYAGSNYARQARQ